MIRISRPILSHMYTPIYFKLSRYSSYRTPVSVFFQMHRYANIHERTVRNIFFRWCLLCIGMFHSVLVVHAGNKCTGAQVRTRATSHCWACCPPHNYSRLTSAASFAPDEYRSSPGATSANPPCPQRSVAVGVARGVLLLAQLILPTSPPPRKRPPPQAGWALLCQCITKRGAKTVANDRISVQLSPHKRVPVASVVPLGAKINSTVIAPCDAAEQSHMDVPPMKLNISPLWNARYSNCCQVLCYVGNGGALDGKCAL